MPALYYFREDAACRCLWLDRAVVSIGREAGNTVVLAAPGLSRRHLQLVLTGTQYAVEDLGSRNGTFLNGQRLRERQPLADGDRLLAGTWQFLYRFGSGGETGALAPLNAVEDRGDLTRQVAVPVRQTTTTRFQAWWRLIPGGFSIGWRVKRTVD